MTRRVARVGAPLIIALIGATSCSAPPPPATETPATSSVSEAYTPPKEGTTTLVPTITARRDAGGGVVIAGRALLPLGTRIWVDVYAPNARPDADPLGHAELYLTSGGAFEAGPFKNPGGSQIKVIITSHFTRRWQPDEVLPLVGLNGLKLPQSALRPNNPQAPQSGGHLEYSTVVSF